MQLRHDSDVHRSTVTDAGRRGDRQWVTSGSVSSVAARTDHGAALCLPAWPRTLTSLPLTAARYGGHPGGRSAPVPQDISLTLWDEWLFQWLGKGASVPDASIREHASLEPLPRDARAMARPDAIEHITKAAHINGLVGA